INVGNRTIPFRLSSSELRSCAPDARFDDVDRATTRALTSGHLGYAAAVLVDFDSQLRVIEANDPSRTMATLPVDDAVDAAFAAGVIQLSEIVFDQTQRHAVVQFAFTCGSLCGHSGAMLLVRDDRGAWAVADRPCGPSIMH